jgi:hypothetical protein
MNIKSISPGLLILTVSMAAMPVFGEEPLPYHYSDEWSVVSAPPPAGPYHPVNIDPRVPGPGTVTALPMMPQQPLENARNAGEPTTSSADTAAQQPVVELPAAVEQDIAASVPGNPPAAGIPATVIEPATPVESAKALHSMPGAGSEETVSSDSYMPRWNANRRWTAPAPGYGRPMSPPLPAYNYPPPGYPNQSMYRGPRNMPPPGYYGPSGRGAEPEVPPPSVYEGNYGRPPYQGAGW